jgi:hypothetical protein
MGQRSVVVGKVSEMRFRWQAFYKYLAVEMLDSRRLEEVPDFEARRARGSSRHIPVRGAEVCLTFAYEFFGQREKSEGTNCPRLNPEQNKSRQRQPHGVKRKQTVTHLEIRGLVILRELRVFWF